VPQVSVIIPAYRAEPTIGRAVRSLLGQTMADWEGIIVSDDRVDYRAVLEAAGIVDRRLVFVATGGVGSGAAAARNVGLRAAAGELIAPLDADDTYAPARLAAMAPRALEAGVAFDNVRVVDDATDRTLFTLFKSDQDFALDVRAFLDATVPLMPVARRSLIGGWDPEIELCDDVMLSLKLFDHTASIPTMAAPLHDYRVRIGSICHSDNSAEVAERSYNVLLGRLANHGHGLRDPSLVAVATAGITAKRALNRAFAAAQKAGDVRTFQEFIAGRHSAG
jgi:glycosyltransferase involved in cell wall biosynthesis